MAITTTLLIIATWIIWYPTITAICVLNIILMVCYINYAMLFVSYFTILLRCFQQFEIMKIYYAIILT